MMRRLLRALATRFPNAARQFSYARYNLTDIYDSYLARRVEPVPTPLGFKFGGLVSDAHSAMQTGTFEPAEVRVLQRWLPRVDLFVDVGANVGYFTCLARSMGKPVIAIEPLPLNLSALYENLRANDWLDTEVLPMGASDRAGMATLFGASSTGASLIDNWAGAPSAFKRTICVTTLDNLLAGRSAGKRLLIKMDVEGHEFNALVGAQGLMRQDPQPIWLVEVTFHEYHPGGHNPNFAATFGMFFASGHRVFLLGPTDITEVSQGDVQRWSAAGKTDSSHVNYLFVPLDMIDASHPTH